MYTLKIRTWYRNYFLYKIRKCTKYNNNLSINLINFNEYIDKLKLAIKIIAGHIFETIQ